MPSYALPSLVNTCRTYLQKILAFLADDGEIRKLLCTQDVNYFSYFSTIEVVHDELVKFQNAALPVKRAYFKYNQQLQPLTNCYSALGNIVQCLKEFKAILEIHPRFWHRRQCSLSITHVTG